MSTDDAEDPARVREAAEQRFAETLARTGAPDPRDRYRQWLRDLRSRDEVAYAKATAYYQQELVPAVARPDSDPLAAWTEYGLRLARRLAPGEAVCIDASGRSRPLEEAAEAVAEDLVLHLPRSARERAMLVRLPPAPTPAQRAACSLLVEHAVQEPAG